MKDFARDGKEQNILRETGFIEEMIKGYKVYRKLEMGIEKGDKVLVEKSRDGTMKLHQISRKQI